MTENLFLVSGILCCMSQFVLVTGGTSGIGRITAQELKQRGFQVAIVGRNPSEAARELGVEGFAADFSSLASVRALAQAVRAKHDQIDVLVNNAGAIYTKRQLSQDGNELTLAVNHLAPFLLTNELAPVLKPGARVVNVASEASRGMTLDFTDLQSARRYFSFRAYGRTKLMNILFTQELAKRLPGVSVNAMHPGFVASNFGAGGWIASAVKLVKLFARTPAQGADTAVWLASDPSLQGVSGKYFMDRREKRPTRGARDLAAQERLWAESERLVSATAGRAAA